MEVRLGTAGLAAHVPAVEAEPAVRARAGGEVRRGAAAGPGQVGRGVDGPEPGGDLAAVAEVDRWWVGHAATFLRFNRDGTLRLPPTPADVRPQPGPPAGPADRAPRRGAGPQIWAKRDDCNAGLAYGGNKTRKLEYLVPDALAQGADTLVSIGGYQSNHTRQVAAVAAHLGMNCVLVQEQWVPTGPTRSATGSATSC